MTSGLLPSSASGSFEIVHQQVPVRDAPSTEAWILRVLRRGTIVQGELREVEGEPWLQLDATSRDKFCIEDSAWMLTDGRSKGLGKLLQRVDTSVKPLFAPTSRAVSTASAARPKGQLGSQLSRRLRVALMEASIAVYATEDFQLELHNAWLTFKGDAGEQVEARAVLCRKVQGPLHKKVLKRSSLASSSLQLRDVFEDHACFKEQDSPSSKEAELSAWLIWLLSPCSQAAYPRGLPPEINARTATDLAELSGTAAESGPRRRVLERVSGIFQSAETSEPDPSAKVKVQVRAALSGDLLCNFVSQSSQAVSNLKKRINILAGIATDEQTLVCGHRVLRDFESVQSLLAEEDRESDARSASASLALKLMRVDPERVRRLRSLENGSCNLWDMDPPDCEDPDYALAAIRRNGLSLKFIPEALKNNMDFILEAVRMKGDALEYASKELQATPEVVMAAVQGDANALCHASPCLRDDKAIVLEAVEKNGLVLRFASESMQANLEVALAAVEESGMALQYVHPDVASHPDVAMTALLQDIRSCKFVLPALRQDPSFLAALERLGLFEDTIMESFLWIENKQADALRQKGAALFLDARDNLAFDVSRVPGALSMPQNFRNEDVSDMPAYQDLVKQPSLIVVVYSDFGGVNSRCAHVAQQLRQKLAVQTRVLRLVGGLNLWKYDGLEVVGDKRRMFAGHAIIRA